MAQTVEQPPIATPTPSESDALKELDCALESTLQAQQSGNTSPPALIGPDGAQVPIPLSAYRALHEIVHHMAQGNSITLVPRPTELTTQQAAEILNISRPFLIRLLDGEEIPYRMAGTHRRIKLEDVLEYRERRSGKRRSAIERLAEKSQELGIY